MNIRKGNIREGLSRWRDKWIRSIRTDNPLKSMNMRIVMKVLKKMKIKGKD